MLAYRDLALLRRSGIPSLSLRFFTLRNSQQKSCHQQEFEVEWTKKLSFSQIQEKLQSLASGRISISTALSFPRKSSIADSGDMSPAYPLYLNTLYEPLQKSDEKCNLHLKENINLSLEKKWNYEKTRNLYHKMTETPNTRTTGISGSLGSKPSLSSNPSNAT